MNEQEAYQRRRWMMPNADLWMRPDAHLWVQPDASRYLKPVHLDERKHNTDRPRAPVDALDSAELDGDAARLRSNIAALRFQLALIRYELRHKALHPSHYDPNQPRVPAGNPDGGRWTRVAENDGPETDASPPRPDRAKGHHYVHQSLYDKLPLQPETRKVFDEATTGRLYDGRSNKYDGPHRTYNEAVAESFNRFTDANKIQAEQMTPDQARAFVKEVVNSEDPRIRNYNMRIQMREIMYRVFRGARGRE